MADPRSQRWVDRLRMILFIPALARHWWKGLSAMERKDWNSATEHFGASQARGLGQNDTFARRGRALAHLGRWSEALAEFEQMSGTASEPYCLFSHCLALAHVGRYLEADAMLHACENVWPPHFAA